MPELAEVEYYRRQWEAGIGARVRRVALHPAARVFRGSDTALLEQTLTGAKLLGSERRAKQMLFRFSRGGWLGVHLGMTGKVQMASADFQPGRHDHLVLFQAKHALVFTDARMFGRVRFHCGKEAPDWWTALPAEVTSREFTKEVLRATLQRRRTAPLKALLLDQKIFPGIGNWMADEILWQARLHPRAAAGELDAGAARVLWRTVRHVARRALQTIGVDWSDPPRGWLMHERWGAGGRCPRDGMALKRETIGGRTTAWCPACQRMPRGRK